MPEHPVIQTERLVLRPLTLTDVDDLYAVYSDSATMRCWHTPPHAIPDDTRTMVTQMLREEACWWTICVGEAQVGVGNVGYLGNVGVPGMGYILRAQDWRQGYMTEAVQAALAYGFNTLELERVELWIDQNNAASQALATKVGFTRRGRFRQKYPHAAQSHETVVYGLYRYEWRQGSSQPLERAAQPQIYSVQPILAVPDVKATAEYYRDHLNFTIDWLYGEPPTFGAVSCKEWTPEGAHIQLTQTTAMLSAPQMISLYLFMGQDIDQWYQRYRAQGVQIERELNTYPWGMREFSVRDCNSYLLRFGTPV